MKVKLIPAFAACILMAALHGCKRETPAEVGNAGVQKLQEWYQSQPVTVKKTSSRQLPSLPAASMQWSGAVYNEGDKAWIVPMRINSSNISSKAFLFFTAGQNAQGSISGGNYAVVIPDNTIMSTADVQALAVTPGMLALANVPASFSGAIIQYGMDKAFSKTVYYQSGVLQPGIAARLTVKADGSDGAPEPTAADECEGAPLICTDWYYQTWVNGILVSEEYLFTTCACGGNEGGGEGGPPVVNTCNMNEEQANAFLAATTQEKLNNYTFTSGIASLSEDPNDRIKKPKNLDWQFLKLDFPLGFYVRYTANFSGVVYKLGQNDTDWKWESLKYKRTYISEGGPPFCTTLNMTNNVAGPIISADHRNASIAISYAVKCTIQLVIYTYTQTYSGSHPANDFDANWD
jgi:hypothetical protein